MGLHAGLRHLERRLRPSGDCPACGWSPDMDRTALLFNCAQMGLTKDAPDPRPICPACQLPEGGIAFLWAEPEERAELLGNDGDRDADS